MLLTPTIVEGANKNAMETNKEVPTSLSNSLANQMIQST